eukprot:7376451-Prymnesium_polylepis.1
MRARGAPCRSVGTGARWLPERERPPRCPALRRRLDPLPHDHVRACAGPRHAGAKFSGPCSSRQLDSKGRHLPVSWGAPHQRRSVSCGTQLLQLVYTCLLCFLLGILASTFSRLPFELYHTSFWDQRQR